MTWLSSPQKLTLMLERTYLGVATKEDAALLKEWQSTPVLFMEWAAAAAPYQKQVDETQRKERLAWLSSDEATMVRYELNFLTDDSDLIDHLTLVASVLGRTNKFESYNLSNIVWSAAKRSLGFELEVELLEATLTN